MRSTTFSVGLFREDSIASKLMGEYAKFVGSTFLQNLLMPVIKKVQNLSSSLDEKTISKFASKIIIQITEHPEMCPFQLRVLCFFLQQEVKRKFNESALQSIGSFLFLRFICPSICSPHIWSIVKKPVSFQATKELVKIAKLIQNLVNSLNNSFDESQVDEFIYSHRELLSKFLTNVGIKTFEDSNEKYEQYFSPIQIQQQEMSLSLENLMKFIQERVDEIELIFSNKNFWKAN